MPRPGQILLSTAVEQYLDLREGRYAKATLYNDRFVLRRFVREVGDVQVMNLRAEVVERWFASLLKPHTTADQQVRPAVTAMTYNNLRARVLQFSRYCQARGMTRADWLVHVTRLKQPRRQQQQVGADTLSQMLDSLDDPRDRAVLATAINTASRSAEIKGLKVGDVDLTNRVLKIWIQKSLIEDHKAISHHLAAELETWLAHYRREVLKHDHRALNDEDYLFPGKRPARITGRRQEGPDGIWRNQTTTRGYEPSKTVNLPEKIAQQALRAVGLPTTGQGLHTIRRSVARIVFDVLVEDENYESAIRTVSSLLNHSSSATTEQYLGLSTETRKRDEFLRTRGVLAPRIGTDAVVISLSR